MAEFWKISFRPKNWVLEQFVQSSAKKYREYYGHNKVALSQTKIIFSNVPNRCVQSKHHIRCKNWAIDGLEKFKSTFAWTALDKHLGENHPLWIG